MSEITIHVVGREPVLSFAAQELQSYLNQISNVDSKIRHQDNYSQNPGIWLGIWDAFDTVFPNPKLENPLDDAIFLKSVEGQLLLSGANVRSVLFAVYAYLESLGCRWVRMGAFGEVLPQNVTVELTGYDVQEFPSHRYRGVCIEGGVSVEQAVDLVSYMAKKRFNTYFIQFQNAYIFWSRWYDRHLNEPALSMKEADEYTQKLIDEVKKHGLALQMVGHGWTCECLGVTTGGWIKTNEELPSDKRQLLAEVNGERRWWDGMPINTELCLSNPQAFNALVDYVVAYAEEHKDVDILHVWMSDGWNNRCECSGCARKLPSDWYVDVLNAIDESMTAKGMDTKIVFLAYLDLLWAPEESRIKNTERFIMMFAPISRLYRTSLLKNPPVDEKPIPYNRNKNKFPRSTAVNIQYLKDWQETFNGDGFTYDYHMLWKHSIIEPTGLFIAEILHEDIVDTEKLNLQGIVNCQAQRYFFPTGLAMEVSGRAMWNKDLSFEQIKREYFAAAFGKNWELVQSSLEKLSKLLDSDTLFGLESVPSQEYRQALEVARQVLEDTKTLINQCMEQKSVTNKGTVASFKYLKYGLRFIEILLDGFVKFAEGDSKSLGDAYIAAGDYLVENEGELQDVCDCSQWRQWLRGCAEELEQNVERWA